MASCDCTTAIKNSGTPDCSALQDVVVKLIMTPPKDSSGAFNRIDLSNLPDDAAIQALINNADDKARLYPFPSPMENVVDERGDAIKEDFNSGRSKFIRNGTREFTGEIIGQGATFQGQIDNYRCTQMYAYGVDSQGNLIGDDSKNDGYLYPMAIDNQSWNAKTVYTTDTTVAKVMLNFQWALSLEDADVSFIAAGDFPSDVNWLTYNGLLDVVGTVGSTITTTTFTMTIRTIYGSAAGGSLVEGLTISDFDLNELSPTPGAIVITSVTESSAGVYDFVIPAATSGDVLALGLDSGVLGYDDAQLVDKTITIP